MPGRLLSAGLKILKFAFSIIFLGKFSNIKTIIDYKRGRNFALLIVNYISSMKLNLLPHL